MYLRPDPFSLETLAIIPQLDRLTIVTGNPGAGRALNTLATIPLASILAREGNNYI